MADVLTTEELNARLMELDGWSAADGDKTIRKTFAFEGFGKATQFVNQVAKIAEKRNHHPDIDIRYDRVTLTLSTHSAGGVTEQDLELARAVDEAGW